MKSTEPINQDALNAWHAAYIHGLSEAHAKYPEDYGWPASEINLVATRMTVAVARGTYNHDSHGIRLTCKRLGIKHTRTAINNFVRMNASQLVAADPASKY